MFKFLFHYFSYLNVLRVYIKENSAPVGIFSLTWNYILLGVTCTLLESTLDINEKSLLNIINCETTTLCLLDIWKEDLFTRIGYIKLKSTAVAPHFLMFWRHHWLVIDASFLVLILTLVIPKNDGDYVFGLKRQLQFTKK